MMMGRGDEERWWLSDGWIDFVVVVGCCDSFNWIESNLSFSSFCFSHHPLPDPNRRKMISLSSSSWSKIHYMSGDDHVDEDDDGDERGTRKTEEASHDDHLERKISYSVPVSLNINPHIILNMIFFLLSSSDVSWAPHSFFSSFLLFPPFFRLVFNQLSPFPGCGWCDVRGSHNTIIIILIVILIFLCAWFDEK